MSCVIVICDATYVNVAFTVVNGPFTHIKKTLRKQAGSGASHVIEVLRLSADSWILWREREREREREILRMVFE